MCCPGSDPTGPGSEGGSHRLPWTVHGAADEGRQVVVVGKPRASAHRSDLGPDPRRPALPGAAGAICRCRAGRSEAHTSELQSLMRISYAVFCLKKPLIKITI